MTLSTLIPTEVKEDAAVRIARAVLAFSARERADRPGFKLTVPELACALRPALALEYPKAKRTARNGGRDLLFDALVEACGGDLDSLTRNYATQVATAKRDILEASPDVTPAEIHDRGERYAKKYPQASLTPTALSSHWPELADPNRKTSNEIRTRAARRDVYVEPPNWKSSEAARLAMNASPETWQLLAERGWFDIAVDIRASILRAL